VRKYDTDGNELWSRQFGVSAYAFAVDADASGVYVAGGGGVGAFVRKYDADGNELWIRQFGQFQWARAVVAHASGIYVAGHSSSFHQAFVRKYDADGNELWTRQFSSASFCLAGCIFAFAVAADAGGVYVAGDGNALPGQTSAGAFVRKYDADGNELWTRQFPNARALAAAADAGGVYVSGPTLDTFSAFGDEVFVRKYDADGNELWTRQFGSELEDEARGIAINASGIYVAGTTWGTLPGQTSVGVEGHPNAFVARLIEPVEVVAVAFDIRPQGCPNPINPRASGVLPTAFLGTADFDVIDIDPDTVRLEGVTPTRFGLEDVATPFVPLLGKEGLLDCTTEGPDGFLDLTLHFNLRSLVAALGPLSAGDVRVLQVTGNLRDGTPIVGEDVVLVVGGPLGALTKK
jgi:hypothetical protein